MEWPEHALSQKKRPNFHTLKGLRYEIRTLIKRLYPAVKRGNTFKNAFLKIQF